MKPTEYWSVDAMITRATGRSSEQRKQDLDEAMDRVTAKYGPTVKPATGATVRDAENLREENNALREEIARLKAEAEAREELRTGELEKGDAEEI